MPTDATCQQRDQLFTALGKASALVAGLASMMDCAHHLDTDAIDWLVEMLGHELADARAAVGLA